MILPGVSFRSQKHPIVRFCLRLRLWSKPSIGDAEMTAIMIGQVFWIALALTMSIMTRDLVTSAVVIGCVDLIGRMFGVRSRYLFVPLWILAFTVCILFEGYSQF